MTRPRGYNEQAPGLDGPGSIRTTAGQPVTIALTITNTAAQPRVFAVTAMGVDAEWLPRPSRSHPIPPGQAITADMTLRPTDGTIAARYPLALAVEALDPATGQVVAPTAFRQIDLLVDAPGQIDLAIDPQDVTAVFGKKINLELRNTGSAVADVLLEPKTPGSVRLSLESMRATVQPGQTIRVPGRLRLSKPSLVQWRGRHTYTVTARSVGAPRLAEGAIKARPMLGSSTVKVLAVVIAIALWAGLAAIFIPKLSRAVHNAATSQETKVLKKTATSGAPSGSPSSGSGGSSGSSGGGKSGGGGGGGTSGGGSGGGKSGGGKPGAAAASAPTAIAIGGTITGAVPKGVKVTLAPSSLGDPNAQGALHSPAAPQTGAVGKLTAAGVTQPSSGNVGPQSVLTKTDGAWAFTKVKVAGYYLLTFSKPGYQTVKYLIDPHSAAASQPMKVNLLPGQGILSGTVQSAHGLVGGATVTISDGSDTIVTSTNSKGTGIGQWSVHGLSTPDTFLVSISAHHLSTESSMITLSAGGTATVNLTLKSGVATISGRVLANGQGLGGAQVVASSGSTPHAATTVTTPGLAGHYSIPDLAPGKYTVTISAPGYETQSTLVKLKKGDSGSTFDTALQSAMAKVRGKVVRLTSGNGLVAQSGAGLTLANATNTYKITSSDNGKFSFIDVVPGTYTLTAEYFGQKPAYQTVIAAVGAPVKHVKLKLTSEKVVDTSTVVGFVGNAVSSGGTLCPKKKTCEIGFQLQQYLQSTDHPTGQWTTIATRLKKSAKFADIPTTAAAASGPTPYILTAKHGLAPGVYQLTVSSLGFLTGIITVRVPLDQLAAAPQVNLYPANKLVGTVASSIPKASVNTDGGYDTQASNPAETLHAANCVWMVPNSTSAPTTCPQQAGAAVEPDQSKCAQAGLPTRQLALIKNDGTYAINNLCDGQYQVYVIINNPAYENPTKVLKDTNQTALDVTVSHGQTATYDPTINRKGRLALTVTATQADNSPLAVSKVTLACGPSGSQVKRTIDVGTDSSQPNLGLAWGFDAGTLTSCVVTDSADRHYAASMNDPTFVNNNDTVESVNLTAPVTSYLFGKVTSSWNGTTHDEPGATVDVQGVTGFVGNTPTIGQATSIADPSSANLITNANGCFVISPDGTIPTDSQVPSDCLPSGGNAFAAANAGLLALHGNAATVHVHGDKFVQDVTSTRTLVTTGAVPGFTSDPTPISASGLKLTANPSAASLSGASIVASPDSADAPGTVSVSVDSAGNLSWVDSSIGQLNKAAPGTYTLAITAAGFKDQTAQVSCLPDPSASGRPSPKCTISNATVAALGALTGTVVASGDGIAANTGIANATVILAFCGDVTVSCPATAPSADPHGTQCDSTGIGRTTDANGTYSVQGSTAQFCMTTGTWIAFVSAPGYDSTTQQFVVNSGSNAAPVITLPAQGRISGRLVSSGNTVDNVPIVGATINAVFCGASSTTCPTSTATTTGPCPETLVTATTSGDGTFAIDEQDNGNYCLAAGIWQLSVNVAGYAPTSTLVTVGSGTAQVNLGGPGLFTVPALGQLSGQLLASSLNNQPVPNAQVTLDWCSDGASAPTTCAPPDGSVDGSGCDSRNIVRTTDGSGRFTVSGSSSQFCMTLGWYQVGVSATGFGTSAGFIQITSGANNDTATVDSKGSLSGTVLAAEHGATGGLPGLPNATLSLFQCSAGQDASNCDTTAQLAGQPFTTKADSNGNYTFTRSGTKYFLDAASSGTFYRLTITADGYDPKTVVFEINNGDNTEDATLNALGSLTGTVTGTTAGGNTGSGPIANATLTLRYCGNDTAPGTCSSSATSPVCNKDGSISAKSDLNGTFATTSASTSPFCMTPGWWQISGTAPGYSQAFATTVINGGSTTYNAVLIDSGDNSVTLPLPAKAGLAGTITGTDDPSATSGAALNNATVSIQFCGTGHSAAQCSSIPSGTPTLTAQTDGNGAFDFSTSSTSFPLDVGEYQMTVTRTGYQPSDPTSVFLDSGTNSQSVLLFALGNLTGHVGGYPNDVDTDPTTALSGATVTLSFCGTTSSAICPASPTTVETAQTNPSGNYTFKSTAGDNTLDIGYWQISVSATGYQPVTDSTLVQIGTGANTASDENLFKLVKLTGTVSGTVGNTGASFTQAVSGATVTATFCGAQAATPVTACPGAADPTPLQVTTQSDVNGKYTFAQGGNSDTLKHGWWQISTSAVGYTTTSSAPFQLSSGTDTSKTVSIVVKNVTQSIAVQIGVGSDTIDTSHVTVTLTRADNCQAPSDCHTITLISSGTTWQASSSPKEGVFLAKDIVPTTYNVVITGDSSAVGSTILQTFGTLVVPLSDNGAVPPATVPVTLIQNNVTGKITGDQGKSTGNGLAGVVVELGTVSGSTFTLGTNAAGHDMTTTTDDHGNFTIAGIPNGTYQLRINEPDDTSKVVDGYVGQLPSTPVVVQYGTVQFGASVGSVGTINLSREAQQLSYVVQASQNGDDLTASTVTLTYHLSAGQASDPNYQSWTQTTPTPSYNSTNGKTTWVWNNVPFGCWTLSALGLPDNHFGTVGARSVKAGGGTDSGLGCGSSDVTVPGNGSGDVEVDQSVSENELDLSVTLTKVNASSPLPNPVTYTVSGTPSPGNTVSFSQGNFPTGSTTEIWVPNFSTGYSLKASAGSHAALWPDGTGTASFTGGSGSANQGALTMDETQTLGEIDVPTFAPVPSGAKPLSATNSLTVTVRCLFPNGTNTEPNNCANGALTATDTGGATNKFKNLQFGSWYVEISGSLAPTSAGPNIPVDLFQAVTVTKGGTVSTSNSSWSTHDPSGP